jgi:hypothetical protein
MATPVVSLVALPIAPGALSVRDDAFAPQPFHFSIPHGVVLQEAAAVAVDSHDRVYCFNRGNVPLLVFDAEGTLLNREGWAGTRSPFGGNDPVAGAAGELRWRGSEFVKPHGIAFDEADNLWLVDVDANVVTKCTAAGRRLLMLLPGPIAVVDPSQFGAHIGRVHEAAPMQSGIPFHAPCNVAVSRRDGGAAYVCDGYGNSRVHKFDKVSGQHLVSWGRSGTGDGAFNLPHDLCIGEGATADGDRVFVADRENHRVQIFDANGCYLHQWRVHRPCGIRLGACFGHDRVAYICQLAASHSAQQTGGPTRLDLWTPNIGNCVTVHLVSGGTIVARLGAPTGTDAPDGLIDPHGIAVDSEGAIYTASVAYHKVGVHRRPLAYVMATLKKFERIARGRDDR